jgi:hypothetical protein
VGNFDERQWGIPASAVNKPDRWPSVCVHRILQHQRGGVVLDRVLDGAPLTRLDGLTELLGLQPELMVESSSFSLEAPPASRRITLCTVSRSPVTSRLNLSELSSDLRNQSMRCTAAPTRGANPGRAGARAGQPRPLPAARRRLGGPVHQPERHNLGHAGRRRGRSCRHRIRQPGRAAVDDPGAAGPLASAVGPGGTSGTPRFPAAVLRHPTETATQRGPFRAKDTASQSIWITAGTVEGEYCSEDVEF